jgi:hypothetical protein
MNKKIFSVILVTLCTVILTGCTINAELQGYLLGNATPVLFATVVAIQVVMASIMLKRSINSRDKGSTRTPPAWSWSFFFKDTIFKIIMGFVFMLAATRILFYFKTDPGIAVIASIFMGLIAHRFGDLFAKAQTASFNLVSDKIDEVSETLQKTAVTIQEAQDQVQDIKADVSNLENSTDQNSSPNPGQ